MKNELINENSLYLRQHSNNPVAWQAYKPETLRKALKENKPLFISIGYSSCHWCHVMAHETFEDEKAAEILNKYFIPIKIDREEFPAIDKMYQFYLHATGKKGGWPLSVFALPDGRPFFGGTYFPPEQKHGLPAFKEIVTQLGELFIKTPAEAKKYADNYDKFHDKFIAFDNEYEALAEIKTTDILDIFKKMFDIEHGGVGQDAKFPNIPVMSALLNYFDDDDVAIFLKMTADKLCTTGIYDHINGGFYRYAVDRAWTVPHFEKMLYDNALNASFLLNMFELTDNILYLKVAEKTIDFILSEFNSDFGLITAMDADSLDDTGKSVEGFYYLVTQKHIEPVAEFVELHEGVINLKATTHEQYVSLEKHFEKLKVSNERVKPRKDEKVILSLNMLFCSTLLKMFEMSGKEFYMEQATALFGKLKHFLMIDDDLFRINYQGEIFGNTTLEDYAYTIKTLIDFFEVTKEKTFLGEAARFTEKAIELFYCDGIFYLDPNKKVVDTFDDSTPNPSGLIIDILENYSDLMGIAKDSQSLDFAADRLIKYAGGHPTLFASLKEYLGK
ncbi:MAG: hypothetical protein C0603_02655 [Denitrovibrio sp.]|nr:MAG: hypothetical protein C0603_02655 [Denitrovibrio sp.]